MSVLLYRAVINKRYRSTNLLSYFAWPYTTINGVLFINALTRSYLRSISFAYVHVVTSIVVVDILCAISM